MRFIFISFIFFISIFSVTNAHANSYPDRPITLVVPFPAGGGTDVHLRTFAMLASEKLGQTIVIENRPGASGSVALARLKNLPSDGYHLSVLVPTSLRLPLLQEMSYDPLKDFTYISMLSGYTYVAAVPQDSSFNTWQDLIDYARENPNKLNYGMAGTNSTMHLVMEEVSDLENISLNPIPYKGDGDQIQDIAGGQLDFGVPSLGVAPMVEAGKIRLLAVFTPERSLRFPDVPTVKEAGTDIIADVPYGLVGPAGMSPEVVKVLGNAFRAVAADEKNQKVLRDLGQIDSFLGPDEYAEWARNSYTKEKELIERIQSAAKK